MNNTLHMNGQLSKLYFGTIKHSGAFSGSSSRLRRAVLPYPAKRCSLRHLRNFGRIRLHPACHPSHSRTRPGRDILGETSCFLVDRNIKLQAAILHFSLA